MFDILSPSKQVFLFAEPHFHWMIVRAELGDPIKNVSVLRPSQAVWQPWHLRDAVFVCFFCYVLFATEAIQILCFTRLPVIPMEKDAKCALSLSGRSVGSCRSTPRQWSLQGCHRYHCASFSGAHLIKLYWSCERHIEIHHQVAGATVKNWNSKVSLQGNRGYENLAGDLNHPPLYRRGEGVENLRCT